MTDEKTRTESRVVLPVDPTRRTEIDKQRVPMSARPYRLLAHPLYAGSVLMGAGLAVATADATAAALIAVGLAPACREYVIASHRSVECGHEAVLARLDLMPLLDLQLRLGEGTGACLGISLLKAAIKIYGQMATFDEAGVSSAEARAAR